MFNRLFNLTITRVALLVGALMAISLVALPVYNLAFAQEDGPIEYAENGDGSVATFTAIDPEGMTPVWSLFDNAGDTLDITGDGDDDVDTVDVANSSLFSIDKSSGVLTFMDPPDYEAPAGGTGNNSNTYMVVVQASDGTNMSWKKVEVEVTNEEEDATVGIEMSSLQPQVSTLITVAYVDGVGNPFVDAGGDANTAIMDPDKDDTNTDTTIDADDVKWQWSRSSSRTGAYSDIPGDTAKAESYTPDSSDANMYLRVTGTYEDGEGEGKTVMATSAYPVRAFRSGNSDPAFPADFDSTMDNDQKPAADVNDGAMEGDVVGDPVTANDANNDRLTYSLGPNNSPSADDDVFQIDRKTGQVSVGLGKTVSPAGDTSEPETVTKQDSFTVTIKATDPAGLSGTVTMTITVDGTDEAPVFTAGKTSHMHKENMAAVYTFAAYDPEAFAVTYSLSGTDAGKFTLTDGELTFDASPDFEMPGDAGGNNVYDVMVKAASTGSGDGATEKSTTLNVMVTVTNENDPGMVDLSATQPRIGVEIRAINLMDPDGMTSGTTWQWERDDAGTIGSPTSNCADTPTWEDAEGMGAEASAYTPEEDDEGKCLRVTATYTDPQGSGKTSMDVSGQPVQKVRNLAPMFTDEDTDTEGIQVDPREVAENSYDDTNVGDPVLATDTADADPDAGNDITYRLSGADAAYFTVERTNDGTGAQIQVGAKAKLDFEATKNTYMVTLMASDPEGLSSSVDVTIMVTNVDEAPDLEGPSNRDFTENGDGSVATFTAIDPEGMTPVWSLFDNAGDTLDITGDGDDDVDTVDVANSSLFSIDKSSGVLTFMDPPDYEAPAGGTGNNSNTYMVVVQASDGTNMSWKKVEVEVTNEEEDATVGIEMSSLQPQVSTLITVAYVDGVGNPFVDAGGDANTAIMDPDKDDTNTDTTIDADDVKWQWSRSSSRTGAYSDIPGDTAKAESYTPDSSDANMYLRVTGTYEDGEGEGKTVMATSAYPVRAFRSGNSDPAFPADFDSTMDNDQKPAADVNDGAMEGDVVGDPVTANDANNDRLTYSLGPNNSPSADDDVFQIDRKTGQVSVGLGKTVSPAGDTSEPETVTKQDSFTVTIKATDPAGLSGTVTMTITVDGTDEAPVFTAGKTSHMHKENMAAVYTFAAYDPEAFTVTYSLSGTDAGKFTLTDGELTFDASPDFEMPGDAGGNNVYDVMVKAASTGSGDGATEKSTTLNVMVTVTNENDPGMVDLSATQPRIGVEIRAINLMDPDGMTSGTTWQWERDDAGTIGSPTSNCADTPTWEDAEGMGAEASAYTPEEDDEGKCLRVTATYTDPQGSGKTSMDVSGQPVQKVRNLAPMFTDEDTDTEGIQVDPREVAENSYDDTNVGDPVLATDTADADPDAGNDITYRLSGADAAYFTVERTNDGTGAQIQVGANAKLDFEATKNTYMVTLMASDPEGLSSSVDVTIMVTNMDEAPEIMEGGLAISGDRRVTRAEGSGTEVATYTASGPESDSARWSLSGADAGDFSINRTSGVLTFMRSPDYENPMDADMDNIYMVTVMANDGTYTAERSVTVTVTEMDDGTVTPMPGTLPTEFVKFDDDESGMVEEGEVVNAVFEHVMGGDYTESEIVRLVFYFVTLPGN